MEALWLTPLATVMRCQAAYMERMGQRVDWEAGKLKKILELLEDAGDGSAS
ncbi:hypothetical protein PDESU_03308 [Pontiella desulfatans]|uniref:Uncharacterized protein n=1 Tax=Pontiella desulfatans TaxID=2750659 RepID=A0A6C2U4H9_PONDE|nr:hypothetical protein [Pontiella desulfatans]VGO14739.1 hypothetical protein PDESU_03308 [Pontiella desulfatans]